MIKLSSKFYFKVLENLGNKILVGVENLNFFKFR